MLCYELPAGSGSRQTFSNCLLACLAPVGGGGFFQGRKLISLLKLGCLVAVSEWVMEVTDGKGKRTHGLDRFGNSVTTFSPAERKDGCRCEKYNDSRVRSLSAFPSLFECQFSFFESEA